MQKNPCNPQEQELWNCFPSIPPMIQNQPTNQALKYLTDWITDKQTNKTKQPTQLTNYIKHSDPQRTSSSPSTQQIWYIVYVQTQQVSPKFSFKICSHITCNSTCSETSCEMSHKIISQIPVQDINLILPRFRICTLRTTSQMGQTR